jgi:biotin operon repressor
VEDGYAAELNDVEVYRTKHQHLCTSFCQIKLAEQRNLKNELIVKNIQELKEQGIL